MPAVRRLVALVALWALCVGLAFGVGIWAGGASEAEASTASADPNGGHITGLRPSPIDFSYTARLQPDRTVPQAVLPASYDLRALGRVTPVRDQLSFGACAAFATLGSLESSLLPGEVWDFSEDNLALNTGFDNTAGYAGIHMLMATAYLTRWDGPVTEASDPYGDSVTPGGLAPVKHMQDVAWFPERASSLDNTTLKNAVMTYGGVYTTMYMDGNYLDGDTNGYYYNGHSGLNHAVLIVGWDDAYAAGDFWTTAPGPGAFIVKNSWGTQWGDDGYFYVSYYDRVFARRDLSASFYDAEPATNYTTVYQYDRLGLVDSFKNVSNDTGWFANVFSAESDSLLQAVGFYTLGPNTTYQVYAGPTLAAKTLLTSGSLATMGYHTITLPTPVPLADGQPFAVAVRVSTPGLSSGPIPVEYALSGYSSAASAEAGQSYTSATGTTWTDITTNITGANVCLKAYAGEAPVPTVTSVTPAKGPTAGGTAVTITGTGLAGDTAVTFGGSAATNVTVLSATQITASDPGSMTPARWTSRSPRSEAPRPPQAPGTTSPTRTPRLYTRYDQTQHQHREDRHLGRLHDRLRPTAAATAARAPAGPRPPSTSPAPAWTGSP